MLRHRPWPTARGFFFIGIVRVLVVGLGIVVCVAILKPIGQNADLTCSSDGYSIVDVELATTAERSQAALTGCDRDDVTSALAWDLPFIALYVGALTLAVVFVGEFKFSRQASFRLTRLSRAGPAMVGAIVLAGLLDLVEDAALYLGLAGDPPSLHVDNAWSMVAATAGWAKFGLLLVVLLYVGAGLIAWVAKPPPRADEQEASETGKSLGDGPSIDDAAASSPDHVRAEA